MPLPEHMRLVNDLQESSTSDGSDNESDSDTSSASRLINRSSRQHRVRNGKKRMSIITNQPIDFEQNQGYYDPCHGWTIPESNKPVKRRFFHSAARWDTQLQRVLVQDDGLAVPRVHVSTLMESGGRFGSDEGSDDEMELEEEEEES